MPEAKTRPTPRNCAEAIKKWMAKRWWAEPAELEAMQHDKHLWLEFRRFVSTRNPDATPDDTVIRVLMPGRFKGGVDDPFVGDILVVRLYQSDPTPRRRAYTSGTLSIDQKEVPALPEPLVLIGDKSGVVAYDCFIASEDWGAGVMWPFSD